MLNLPAQGRGHEENDNSQWLPINIPGVCEGGDVLLINAVDFKHPSPLAVSVRELGKGGC